MKHYFPFREIEDDTPTAKALIEFVKPMCNQPTLSECLNRLMAEKNMTAPEVYHRADLDRQTFNRITQFGSNVRASKRTLLQVAIGFESSEQEAKAILVTCGFTFELASTEDQAFLFCIRNGFYNMFFVNEAIEFLNKAKNNENN